ncbi:serine hydrolase domain-containing protein [Sinomicrobium weinanense]|uniref:Serine hydrolase n=1 Tax=Sinomicrobium weinanense TaxID=2842200 RepID=A0A926JPI4_9FLAO|nr:serine hydrolase domain-containing protein [Sinomicrobium weinanense]MBC9795090.1 serine hydrolase [Sinomicrobium weinanense]MBU3123779.1 serine hydrolase [Sinomicrobium weinanense]
MNTKIKFLSLFILSILYTSCKAQQKQEVKNLYKHYKTIDSLISNCHNIGVFNGNAIVSVKDTTVYNKSFGYTDGSGSEKIDDSSIYSIGSIAKEFNAISIMILAEKQLLDINDSIYKFNLGLPEWSKQLKIKHLLSYSSGLPGIDYENSHHNENVYNRLKSLQKLDFEPGTGYNYNNNSIFLQRLIIEKVSGQKFEDFVTENIIKPLELKSAVFDPDPSNKHLVKAFNNENQNDKSERSPITGWIYISNNDLHKYLISLHRGKIISKESLFVLAHTNFQGKQSSLGRCELKDNQVITHYHQGSSYNYEALIYSNSTLGLSITMTTNNKNFKLGEIAGAIENIIQDKPFEMPKKSVYLTIREKCYDNVDEGIRYYYELKNQFPDDYNFSNPSELARVGYKLIEKNQIKDAIKIFKLLAKEFPKEPYAYDSLGEAYFRDKQFDLALSNYKKAIALGGTKGNAKKMVGKIEKVKNK